LALSWGRTPLSPITKKPERQRSGKRLQKHVAGWVIWTIANLGWIVSFSHKGMLAEAFLFSVYLVLSVYGIFKWWTPRPQEDKG